MRLFLLVYDRRASALRSREEYAAEDRSRALRRRAELEKELRGQPEIEVVVLAAESLDALKKTHARYFETLEEQINKPGEVATSDLR